MILLVYLAKMLIMLKVEYILISSMKDKFITILATSLLLKLTFAVYDDYFLPDPTRGLEKDKPPAPSDGSGGAPVTEKPTGYICQVCVVVDRQFAESFKLIQRDKLVDAVSKLMDYASWIFRSVDWDNDGVPDNIGFAVRKVFFGWKYSENNHFETPKPAIDILRLFSKFNFSDCCLGMGLVNMPFQRNQNGVSFAASDQLLGGICDHRDPREGGMLNVNAILITATGINGSQLTWYQVTKAVLHELGHAFGVHAHDNDYNNPQCWGFEVGEKHENNQQPRQGRYLMWASSVQKAQPLLKNTQRFSPCSRESVANIVNKRKYRKRCFDIDYNPFCGNGIVEGIEMCDCGNQYECEFRCCGSRKSTTPCMPLSKEICSKKFPKNSTLRRPNSATILHRVGLSGIPPFYLFISSYYCFNYLTI